jgi:fructoselysine-6-P-deglycase FrlB-like protein
VGKPYQQELERLPPTYEWALRWPLDEKCNAWKPLTKSSLIAVGSGGSYTAATLAVYLHEYFTGQLGKATTPLEAILSKSALAQTGVLLFTAGGSNPDVLGAFRELACRAKALSDNVF